MKLVFFRDSARRSGSPKWSQVAGLLALSWILWSCNHPAAALADQGIEFSPAQIIEWRPHVFKGTTHYELTDMNDTEAVHARCEEATASGLYLRESIDLRKTPIMEWNWRVDETFTDIDETSRAGDDYPARLYVVDERRVMRWRTRALNYVWASQMAEGSDWPNAYLAQNHMIAVRSGPPEESGQWFTQRRNVREDFMRYHGRVVDRIDAVAIMTDCDDTGQRAQAWYGTIRFLPESE